MDALILAAGLGSRIRGLSPCKPLTLVLGMPLIERAVRAAARAGVQRVVVATGWRGDAIEAVLPGIAASLGITIDAQRVGAFDRPNGFSVMAGASRIKGDYLLMMADHVLSWRILSRLAGQGRADRGVTLAVDRRTSSPLVDPADATWVSCQPDGRIRRIGKGLAKYDCVDCGAFLATPELARAIEAAVAAGRPGSLSDGMQVLADAGRAATMDIGEEWWIDVDDPAAHAMAETLLARRADEVPGPAMPYSGEPYPGMPIMPGPAAIGARW